MRSDESRPDPTGSGPSGSGTSSTRHRIELSGVQILASVAAAVSAAVAASVLGVAGTIAGTAVISVVATIGNALYTASLTRTTSTLKNAHVRVLRRVGARPAGPGDARAAIGSVLAASGTAGGAGGGATGAAATARIPTQSERTGRLDRAAADTVRIPTGPPAPGGHGTSEGAAADPRRDVSSERDTGPTRVDGTAEVTVRFDEVTRPLRAAAPTDETARPRVDEPGGTPGDEVTRVVWRPIGAVSGTGGTVYGPPPRRRSPAKRAVALAGGAVLVFVLAFGLLSGIEALLGTSFSALWGHGHSGSTAGALFDGGSHRHGGGGTGSRPGTAGTPGPGRSSGRPSGTPSATATPGATPGHRPSQRPSRPAAPVPSRTATPSPTGPSPTTGAPTPGDGGVTPSGGQVSTAP